MGHSSDISDSPSRRVIRPHGEIDLSTVPPLRAALHDLITDANDTAVVVDLADVQFIDSSGIAVLVSAYRRAREAGLAFSLARPTSAVAKVLALTQADRLIPVIGYPGDPDPVTAGAGL